MLSALGTGRCWVDHRRRAVARSAPTYPLLAFNLPIVALVFLSGPSGCAGPGAARLAFLQETTEPAATANYPEANTGVKEKAGLVRGKYARLDLHIRLLSATPGPEL